MSTPRWGPGSKRNAETYNPGGAASVGGMGVGCGKLDTVGGAGAVVPPQSALALSGVRTVKRVKLTAAQNKDPGNKFVANNLQLLDESYRKGKAVE